ncbi:hypothetical protein EDD22DRAFT_851712 [Suillus occidentalis]|nr:hypothetical protein EDD22DRAFT_851712 [Suillus occidentalis]
MPPRRKNARATVKAAVVVPIPPTPVAAPISPAAVAAPISPVAASISPTHATVPITPTAAPGPTAAAANVNANILRNPQRHHQLPAQFQDNDAGEGESFHPENVSGDEGDEMVNSPAPASIADCMQ